MIFAQTGGTGTSAYMCWYLNLPAFAKAGYRVLAPDFVGCGFTESLTPQPARVDAVAFLAAFMDALEIEGAHFVGNSMGCNAMTRLAIEHPQRVNSLIMTGGEPRVATEESAAVSRELGRTPRIEFVRQMVSQEQVSFEDMKKATQDFFYDRDHPRIDEVTALRLEMANRPGVLEKERAHYARQATQGRATYGTADLEKIQAPVYLIHGRDERFFYDEAAAPVLLEAAIKAMTVIPHCSCTVLSHCGHWPQIEMAETFNALALQFLKDSEGTGNRRQ